MKHRTFLLWIALMFLITMAANAQDSINCQPLNGEHICEVTSIQTYESSTEALRIASLVQSKTSTEVIIGRDTVQVSYTNKEYRILGYGSQSIVLAKATSIKDTRNELIVILSGILIEEENP
jgi:hypothetical protein